MTAHEPLSWLRLERFHLGESPPSERARLEAHLLVCPSCRQRLDQIEGDLRPLPTLPPIPAPRLNPWFLRLGAPGLALAAAAVVALLWPLPSSLPGPHTHLKGGELAMELVRERAGHVVEGAQTFQDGDRILVRLTCPPGVAAADVVVFQQDQVFFPLDEPVAPRVGNQAPLPGAFTLTGPGDVQICVVAGDQVPTRQVMAADGLGEAQDAVCAALEWEG